MVVIVTVYTLFVKCDVTNMTSHSGLQPMFWKSLLTQHAYLGTPEQQ